jgi:Cyclin, N-terminal domain
MACKMEEIVPPLIEEMAVFGSGIFNEKDMLRYEIQIANVK